MAHKDQTYMEIRNLEKVYQSRNGEVKALGQANFDLGLGRFVSIVGPSGCGKSTLLKIILGVIQPTGGEVKINGKEIRGPQSNIGMVFQSPNLLPWRTILDNILLPIEVLNKNKNEYKRRALSLLEMVGLKGFSSYYPKELSGGMQQRVGICRALIHDPPILLLDEPFGALDSITREQLNDDLLDIWETTKKTILLVTHSIDEAVYMSDEVIVMSTRPSEIVNNMKIDLPRPRIFKMKSHETFTQYAIAIRESLGLINKT